MPLQEEFPGITGLVNLGSNFVENTNRVLEGAGQIQSGKDSTQVNEEARPIGSEAILNGKPVFWAGQNYGYQTKESYDKLMDEGQFRMGEITAQRIGNSISQAIPQEAKDFATEKITDAATAAEDFYNQQDYDTQQNIKTGLRFAYGAVTTIDKGLEFISKKTNTSRFITDELVTAAATGGASVALKRAAPIVKQAGKTAVNVIDTAIDDILTPPGGGLQLATVGSAPMGLAPSASNGSISLRPQVMEAKRDKFYNQGEWDVTQGKRIDEARDAVDSSREIMENIKDANPGVKHGELRKTIPEYKAADKALRAKMPRISSEESNLLAPSKGREQAYPPAKPRAKELKGIFTRQARREKVRKGVDQIIEQVDLHHKFPKGISAAFFNRGRDLIEDGVMTYNELVNMAKRAQKKGIEPGDIETNLEPMFKTPHDTFHAEMRAQPSYQFPGDNLEISKTKLTQRLRQVKNKKDLNELWDQLLSEDAKYLYETAEIWQPMDKAIKSVSPEYTGTAKSKK